MDDVYAYMATLDAETQAAMQAQIDQAYAAGMTDDQIVEQFAAMLPVPQESDATYEGNLEKMGVADVSEPTSIEIYAKDFESKELITNLIEDYNAQMEEDGEESKVLQYTDYCWPDDELGAHGDRRHQLHPHRLRGHLAGGELDHDRHHHLHQRARAHQGDRASCVPSARASVT